MVVRHKVIKSKDYTPTTNSLFCEVVTKGLGTFSLDSVTGGYLCIQHNVSAFLLI